jgi:hypothetical protein
LGLNWHIVLAGTLAQLSTTLPLKPPMLLTVQVLVPLPPAATVRLLGAHATLQPVKGTVTSTEVNAVLKPLKPSMDIVLVPAGAPLCTLMVSTLFTEPPGGRVTVLGAKLQLIENGGLGQNRLTSPPKPPTLLTVQVVLPAEPPGMVSALGTQAMVNPPPGVTVTVNVNVARLAPVFACTSTL